MTNLINFANNYINSSISNDAVSDAQKIARAILYTIIAVGVVICIAFIAINGTKLSKVEDDQQYALAKKRLKAAIVGLVITVGAGTIGTIIVELADKIFH